MILGRKVGNLRLISSEDLFFREHYFLATKVKKPQTDSKLRPFFFIENTDEFVSFNERPDLALRKYCMPNYRLNFDLFIHLTIRYI